MAKPGQSAYPTLQPMAEELQGERVLLRRYRLADAPALHEAIAESREHLRPWESFADAFQTLAETQDWIIRRTARGCCGSGSRSACGTARVAATWANWSCGPADPRGWAIPAFTMAYWVRQSEQGHGYVTEGVRLLTGYAFQSLGAQRVELGIDAKNARSVALARRCGFVLEGRLRHTGIEDDGALVDNLIFALVPTDPREAVTGRCARRLRHARATHQPAPRCGGWCGVGATVCEVGRKV